MFKKHSTSQLIHVDVTLSASLCPKCQNQYVKLYAVYEDLVNIATNDKLINKVKDLPLIKKIVPKKEKEPENHHVQFQPKDGYKGLSLVFRAEGGCLVIYNITMMSFYCEKATKKAVSLPRTNSPGINAIRVNASCAKDTASEGEAVYGMCSSNGTWHVEHPCSCKKGYDLGNSGCQSMFKNIYLLLLCMSS